MDHASLCLAAHPCSASSRPVAGLKTCTGAWSQNSEWSKNDPLRGRSATTALRPSRCTALTHSVSPWYYIAGKKKDWFG